MLTNLDQASPQVLPGRIGYVGRATRFGGLIPARRMSSGFKTMGAV